MVWAEGGGETNMGLPDRDRLWPAATAGVCWDSALVKEGGGWYGISCQVAFGSLPEFSGADDGDGGSRSRVGCTTARGVTYKIGAVDWSGGSERGAEAVEADREVGLGFDILMNETGRVSAKGRRKAIGQRTGETGH